MEIFFVIVNVGVIAIVGMLLAYWVVAPIVSVPFFRSFKQDLLAIFETAELSKEDKFIDLGSGDGHVVLEASKLCKLAVGVEHNPFLTIWARFRELIQANGRVKFLNKSYQQIPLQEYSVVYLYLNPEAISDITNKLEQELSPGTRIISYKYEIKNWKPEKIEQSELSQNKYYRYTIGQQH